MSFTELKRRTMIWSTRPGFIFTILLVVDILAYGLLVPWLHLYADDWLWAWTWENFGSAGLVKYFATNRPVWGLLFQGTMPLLGGSALAYQIFALVIRWLSSLAFWWLLRLLLPKQRSFAFWGAAIFLVYPGFVLQSVALTYSHVFVIFTFFLLSICFQLMAIRGSKPAWAFQLLAILLSLANLLSLEYFFMLELARPIFLWIVASENETRFWTRVSSAVRRWLPYLGLWMGIAVWRLFFFNVQTYNYKFNLLTDLRSNPLETLATLARTIFVDLFQTSLGAWAQTIDRFLHLTWSKSTGIITFAICAVVFILSFLVGLKIRRNEVAQVKKGAIRFILVGLVMMLISGIPFWAIRLDVKPDLLDSRLTLPFMLGAIILLLGIAEMLPFLRWRFAILAAAVALAAGSQFQNANDFQQDWINTRKMMWEIAWRIPDLSPGTTILTSDIVQTFYKSQDLANSAALSTQLNIIYQDKVVEYTLDYYLNFAREVDANLPNGLEPDTPIIEDNVTADFHGTTDQLLAATVSPKNCFRLLDPTLDAFDETQSKPIREAAALTNLKWILTDAPDRTLPSRYFGEEPEHGWCYYFEKGELARQVGDWDLAAKFGEQAIQAGFQPHDKMEWLGFIEAFAHTDQWELAVSHSEGFPEDKQPMICRLWQRITQSTPESDLQRQTVENVYQFNNCE